MLIYLCDNPLAPIAAVANAKKASFIFSEQAANAGLDLPNFTEFIEGRLGPMVKRLEANLKPAVTYEQKFDQLKSEGFWACDKNGKQPYFLKASAYKQLNEETVRSHLLAHGLEASICRHETKESKIARLTALAATKVWGQGRGASGGGGGGGDGRGKLQVTLSTVVSWSATMPSPSSAGK